MPSMSNVATFCQMPKTGNIKFVPNGCRPVHICISIHELKLQNFMHYNFLVLFMLV